MSIDSAQIHLTLDQFVSPVLGGPLLAAGAIESLEINNGKIALVIQMAFPVADIQKAMGEEVRQVLADLPDVKTVSVDVRWQVGPARPQVDRALEKVKNIIAVASGKGGVGKSTTSVNLALALVQQGAKVGLLDADIYGPSQQLMLGVRDGQKPDYEGTQFLKPIEAHGIKTMSMGYLVNEKTPMVWRGPMAGGALTQMLTQTWWGDLDYLIIDMPPGTGDIQLTLAQKAKVSGAVIVTTPQDIALLDARKGIEMFRKVEVPVLGVVENMAIHICSQCGHAEHVFGEGGGDRIAKDYGVPLLGSLPLALKIREHSDSGKPSVVAEPNGDVAQLYRQIARRMASVLAVLNKQGGDGMPQISITDD